MAQVRVAERSQSDLLAQRATSHGLNVDSRKDSASVGRRFQVSIHGVCPEGLDITTLWEDLDAEVLIVSED